MVRQEARATAEAEAALLVARGYAAPEGHEASRERFAGEAADCGVATGLLLTSLASPRVCCLRVVGVACGGKLLPERLLERGLGEAPALSPSPAGRFTLLGDGALGDGADLGEWRGLLLPVGSRGTPLAGAEPVGGAATMSNWLLSSGSVHQN